MDLAREKFLESLQRCLDGGGFLDRFYERFLASSPDVRALFESTDFSHQNRAMRKSLLMLVYVEQGTADGLQELDMLAERHAGLGISAHHYDLWLESLVGAARELDPRFDAATEAAWRSVVGRVVRLMKERLPAGAA